MPSDTAIDVSVRVVTVYATDSDYYGGGHFPETGDYPWLDILRAHYDLYRDQLPQPLPTEALPASAVSFRSPVTDLSVRGADALMFALPSSQVVFVLALEITVARSVDGRYPESVRSVLEQCIAGELRVNGRDLAELVPNLLVDVTGVQPAGHHDGFSLLPERHQLIFIRPAGPDEQPPGADVVDELVFRQTPPYRDVRVRGRFPDELNEEPFTRCAVTRYASLVYGQPEYVENSILLSTVQAIGMAARCRQIRQDAYRELREFRQAKQRAYLGTQTRDDLERLTEALGKLEFDFAFTQGFPVTRLAGFDSALAEALDLVSQADTMRAVFAQIGGSVRRRSRLSTSGNGDGR